MKLVDLYEARAPAWQALIEDADGCLAIAAHRLACRRLKRESLPEVPTAGDIFAAAAMIHSRAGLASRLPVRYALADDCVGAGLCVAGR